jgi:ATP-dependent helicase/nuclease subunit A
MAQREFTPEQRRAIDTRDRTLLVSAAAGSGKTATLTERIISSLLDEKNPTDITSILVVTFTNAAAGELRERIGAALSAAIKSGKTALVGQLRLLSMASISTIDSFCADVLRQNAERVGISPSFRIADEAESELLLLSVLEGLVDSIYEGVRPEVASAEELAELSFALSDAKNPAALYEVLEFIYEKLITTENGIKSLLPLINVYKNEEKLPTEEKTYGKYIMQSLRAYTEHFTRVISSIRDEIPTLADYGKLAAVMDADLSFLHSLGAAKTYGEARELLLNRKHPTKPTFKSNEPPHFAEYVRARDKMKEEAGEFFTKRLFSYTDEEWQRLYSGLYEKLSVLYKFLLAFDEDFAREKKRRGICRYSDVERYAYECLWQDGERTDVAEALREKYSAIYIDEYQDVNNLQDKIFEAISRPNNRFMVGDIKQSIYAFRSARPEIFAKMKNEFPDIESSTGDTASIFMSKNFRSDRGIIDFTNAVFDRAFSAFGESIGYKNEDRLTFAKTAPSSDSTPTLTVFDKGDKDEDEDGEELGRVNVIANSDVEKITLWYAFGQLLKGFFM